MPTRLVADTHDADEVLLTAAERDRLRRAEALPGAAARWQARREAADAIIAARARGAFGDDFDAPGHSNDIARRYWHVFEQLVEARSTDQERAEIAAQLAEGARHYQPTSGDIEIERARVTQSQDEDNRESNR